MKIHLARAQKAVWSLGCGTLIGVAIVTPSMWFISIGALAVAMHRIRTSPTLSSALVNGYLVGVGLMAVAASWIFLSYPTEWLGIQNMIGALVLFSVWFVYVAAMGLATLPWSYLVWRVPTERSFLGSVAVAALGWGFGDVLRAFIYTLISWAPGHIIGLHGGFGLSGLALAWSDELLWLARIGGVWSLSITLGAIAAVVLYVVERTRSRPPATKWIGMPIAGAATVVLFLTCIPSAAETQLGTEVTVVNGKNIILIQTDFPRSFTVTREMHGAQTTQISAQLLAILRKGKADVVVLPEDSRFSTGLDYINPDLRNALMQRLQEDNVSMVDSSRKQLWNGVHNVIEVHTFGSLEKSSSVAKVVLAPFGEYVPALFSAFWSGVGLEEETSSFVHGRAYLSGGHESRIADHIFMHDDMRFGALSCSEVLSPSLFPAFPREVDLLVNVSSVSWVRGSALLFNQMLAMAKVHSVHAQKIYVQATNGGPNIVITPH